MPSDLHAPAAARRWVRQCIADWGPTVECDVMLATSELVTNAILHGGMLRYITVRADESLGVVRVSVADVSTQPPQLWPQAPDRIGGLGLHVVDNASSAWGYDLDPDGKVVWFEVPITPWR